MADDFKNFEHERWEAAVDQYDASFGKLTQQTVPRMLDVLEVAGNTRFLDIACGPGYVTAAAASRGAQAVGVDFAAAMIAKARRNFPTLTFREGDAENLTGIANGSFDAVAMNFGILHLANPEKAIAEIQRVLKPGGRFAFTLWRKPEEALAFSIIHKAIEKHGNPKISIPEGPPFFLYTEPSNCERLLADHGFTHNIEILPLKWRLSDPDELFTAFSHGSARTGGILRQHTAAELTHIRQAAREAVLGYVQDGQAWGIKKPGT